MGRTAASAILIGILIFGGTSTALADDGQVVSGAAQSLTCLEVTFPAGAQNTVLRITGGTGDADLYIYPWNNGTPPSYVDPNSATCAPYQYGNEETCDSELPDGGNIWWACLKGYSAGSGYSNVHMLGEYNASGSSQTFAASVSGASQYYIDYWKDDLFLGIAYHRIACLSAKLVSGARVIVSELDYDGFSNGNYCRRNEAWNSPLAHGASSLQRSDAVGASFSTVNNAMNACGTQANNRYGTPNYARRSNTCSYNILDDCNSDCWIREFSGCVSGQLGVSAGAIGIASPCW